MNYIIFDLEFNQLYTKKNAETQDSTIEEPINIYNESKQKNTKNKYTENYEKSNTHIDNKSVEMPFEIIQIGALKLNEDLEIISTFERLIKPSLYKEIHPFIEDLTQITTDMVENKELFPTVYKDFMNFIGSDDFIMCVWGVDDIKQLMRNINFHKLNIHNNIKKYIDIQKLASKEFNMPKGNRLGLKTAVEFWNIPITNDFHNALNDAVYTADVFRKVFTSNIKPCVYSNPNYNRSSKSSLKVDTENLLAQFEKMFNRKMTKEEKCIIRIAYNMGKTNQFLK